MPESRAFSTQKITENLIVRRSGKAGLKRAVEGEKAIGVDSPSRM